MTEEDCASPHPGLLDTDTACRQLKVSRPTLWRLINTGELAKVNHARKAWIPQSEITDYFQRRIADASKAARDRRAATRQKAKRRTKTSKGETDGDQRQPDTSGDTD